MSAREVSLTKGLKALVDPDDYEHVKHYKWYASAQGTERRNYAVRWQCFPGGIKKKVWMHRFVMGVSDNFREMVVDHKNGNGLDNRRENLEVVPYDWNLSKAGRTRRLKEEDICL